MLSLLTFAKWFERRKLKCGKPGPRRSAQATVTLLGINLSRLSNFCSSLCTWRNDGGRGINHVFARQALPMVWDFAETKPLNEIAASWPSCLRE